MDPLSAAASIIAVLSLAIQTDHNHDESTSACIRSSLSSCVDTVKQIECILIKVKTRYHGGDAISKGLIPFWLLCKKSRIEELEKQLGREVLILNLTLTLRVNGRHVWPIASYQNQLDQAPKLQHMVSHSDEGGNLIHAVTRTGETLLVRRFAVYKYKSILGSVTTTKDVKVLARHGVKSIDSHEDERRLDTRKLYIWPSFLPWCVEFHIKRMSQQSPEIGLRPIHVIDSQIEQRLRRIFFDKDLIGLRRAISSGDITPYSLDRSGQSLLTFAQLYLDENAVVLLSREGCPVGISNIQACTSWAPFHESTFRLLCSALDLTEFPVDAIFPDSDTSMAALGWYEWFTTQSLPHTSFALSEWLGSKLYVEARTWANIVHIMLTRHHESSDMEYHKRQRIHWEKLMIQSIQKGANRQYLDKYEFSAMGLWIRSYHPLDAQEIIDAWLELLESCGISIIADLQAEIELFKAAQNSHRHMHSPIRRRKVALRAQKFKGPQAIVSWDINYKGLAEEALIEFNGLGDDEAFLSDLRFSKPSENDWERFWPFAYNAAVDCQGGHQGCFRCRKYWRKGKSKKQTQRQYVILKKASGVAFMSANVRVPGSWLD
ncbi:hypothetical protein F5Y10DRAFT_288713 [Nemania abortiva]|nr:hypothetical protein F5Y10DRAFT_288713 [Nemania abortiva]